MKLEFSRQTEEKCTNIKFHGNQPSQSQVAPCGRMDRLGSAILNFANMPTNRCIFHVALCLKKDLKLSLCTACRQVGRVEVQLGMSDKLHVQAAVPSTH